MTLMTHSSLYYSLLTTIFDIILLCHYVDAMATMKFLGVRVSRLRVKPAVPLPVCDCAWLSCISRRARLLGRVAFCELGANV